MALDIKIAGWGNQVPFINDKHRYVGLFGGIGCIDGHMEINGVPIAEHVGGSVNTLYGSSPSTQSFIKGRDDLYRVTTESGRVAVVTLQHRFLTPNGWRQLESLSYGDVIACCENQRESSDSGKSQGFQDYCYASHYQHGELPSPEIVVALDKLQQLRMTDACNSAYLYPLAVSLYYHLCKIHSSYREHVNPSMTFSLLPLFQDVAVSFQDQRQTLSLIHTLIRLIGTFELLPASASDTLYNDRQDEAIELPFVSSSDEQQYDCIPYVSQQELCCCTVDKEKECCSGLSYEDYSLPYRGISHFGSTTYEPYWDAHSGAWQSRAHYGIADIKRVSLDRLLPSMPPNNTQCTSYWDVIQDIRYDHTGDYYDLHVPFWEHYESGGIYHHNSGKTRAGVDKDLKFCTEHQGVSGLITAPDYNRIHGSIIPMFMERFPKAFWKVKPHGNPPEAMTILGNRLYFRTTTNPEDLRGYNVGFAHMDEGAYSPYEALLVLQGRLRAVEDAQLWVTTTPNQDNPLNWTYGEFVTKDSPDHSMYTLNTLENPFLPESYLRDLLAQYSGDLQLIELQGLFIPISGNCFFETMILRQMLDLDAKEPKEVLRNGAVKVFKPAGIGKRYVCGIDTAEGRQAGDTVEGSGNPDFNACRIQDFHTGEDVLEIHTRMPMDEFLDMAVGYIKEYNNALTGIEINFNKDAAKKLIDLGLDEKYVYHRGDGKNKEAGWLTTSKTRMPMLTEYEEAIRSHSCTMYSKECIMEHLSFIRNASGRPQAANNAHDDLVIAGAICWQMRKYMPAAPKKITSLPARVSWKY